MGIHYVPLYTLYIPSALILTHKKLCTYTCIWCRFIPNLSVTVFQQHIALAVQVMGSWQRWNECYHELDQFIVPTTQHNNQLLRHILKSYH